MKRVLQFFLVAAVLASSRAVAEDRVRLAQVITPGQVQPVPLTPTPLISSQGSTACLVACDTQSMNCQNACIVVGPTVTTSSPAGTSPCTLNCTTQQLVCKQVCTRPRQ